MSLRGWPSVEGFPGIANKVFSEEQCVMDTVLY